MKCEKCGTLVECRTFLGWPVSMWYEIREFLLMHGAPGRSPLSILSRLAGRTEK